MRKLTLAAQKNSLEEIVTYISESGAELINTRQYRDGEFAVFFPEDDQEEQGMLESLYVDTEGRSYPEILKGTDQNIDLSDYVHELIHTGVMSSSYKVLDQDEDVTTEYESLILQLESLEDYDIEEYLENNGWEIDLQYFLVKEVSVLEYE